MKTMQINNRRGTAHRVGIVMMTLMLVAAAGVWTNTLVFANHPVLVEGEEDFDREIGRASCRERV